MNQTEENYESNLILNQKYYAIKKDRDWKRIIWWFDRVDEI